jgi:hypothetical protein
MTPLIRRRRLVIAAILGALLAGALLGGYEYARTAITIHLDPATGRGVA